MRRLLVFLARLFGGCHQGEGYLHGHILEFIWHVAQDQLRLQRQVFNVGNMIHNNISFAQGMNGVFGQDAAVLNRWMPTNTNNNIPRAVYGDPSSNCRVSDRFSEDGSYGRFATGNLFAT